MSDSTISQPSRVPSGTGLSKRQQREANRRAQAYPKEDRPHISTGKGKTAKSFGGTQTCAYCKEEGHVIKTPCPNLPCKRCNRKGHVEENCETPFCIDCERYGHSTDSCWNCDRCGKRGHLAEKCFAIKCGNCDKFGHEDDKCWLCEKCNRYGHLAENCRTPCCEECGKYGHVAEKCYQNLFCDLCLRNGHISAYCRTNRWCWYCKDSDHYPGNCEEIANLECEICNERGHDARSCSQNETAEHTPGDQDVVACLVAECDNHVYTAEVSELLIAEDAPAKVTRREKRTGKK